MWPWITGLLAAVGLLITVIAHTVIISARFTRVGERLEHVAQTFGEWVADMKVERARNEETRLQLARHEERISALENAALPHKRSAR